MTPSENNDSTGPAPSSQKPPKPRLSWAFRLPFYAFLGILLLLGILLVAIQLTPVQNRLLSVVERTVSKSLGATISIDHFEGNFISNLALEDISLSSADGVPILFAKRISADYSLTGLIFRTLRFRDISIHGLRLDLTKNASGEWNLPSGSGQKPEPAPKDDAAAPFRVQIARLLITDTRINMQASDTMSSLSPFLDISRFSAALDTGDTITVSIEESDFSLHRPATFPLALSGRVSFNSETAMLEFDHFLVNSGSSRIILDGNYGQENNIPVFSVALDASRVDLAEISDRLSLSALPRSVVTGSLAVSGTLESFQSDLSLNMDDAAVKVSGAAGLDGSRGLWTDLSAGIREFDIRKTGVAALGPLSGVLSADISLNGNHLLTPEMIDGVATATLKGLAISGIPLSVDLNADASGGAFSLHGLEVVSGQNRLEFSGTIAPSSHTLDLDISLDLPVPSSGTESLFANLPNLDISLDGAAHVNAALTGWVDYPKLQFHVDSTGVSVQQHRVDTVSVSGVWEGLPGPDVRLDNLDIALRGLNSNLLSASSLDLRGSWQGWIETPAANLVMEARGISVNGAEISTMNLSGDLKGHPDAEDARAEIILNAGGIKYDQIEADSLKLHADGQGPVSGFSGRASLEVGQADLYGEHFSDFSLTGTVDPGEAIFSLSGDHQGGSRFQIDGNIASWKTAPREFTLETVAINTTTPWPACALSNDAPLRLSLSGNRLDIDSCDLHINDATLSLSGGISTEGPLSLDIDLKKFDLAGIPGAWRESLGLSGALSLTATINGAQDRPQLSMQIGVKDLACRDISRPADLSATIDYADNSLSIRTGLEHQGNQTLLATGEIPLQLSLKPFSLAILPENITGALKTSSLKLSDLPIPPVADIEWDAAADIDLQFSGTTDAPDLSGSLSIRDGFITLVKNRLTYESVTAAISVSDDRIVIDRLLVEGDREGRLSAGGTVFIKKNLPVIADLTLSGENFYIPYEKSISARVTPDLHLSGSMANPRLSGEVTISESRINLDKLSQAPKSDIQVIETDPSVYDPEVPDDTGSEAPDFFSALSADIAVHVPRNAWLKGQDVNAEIAGDISIRKKAGESFLLTGPLSILRGNYYFMGKNFTLTEGDVEFLGLRDINPNLNIETETRIKSVTIIATLHGAAREMMIDLSSDPAMEESAIISYLVFGKDPNDLSGNQAFSAEKTALGYTSGLLASELRSLLGDAAFIDTFSIDSGSSDNTFGSVTFGKYITPEIFISHRQGLSEDEQSYQEITYELTPQIKLETQLGKDEASSADITWEFDF